MSWVAINHKYLVILFSDGDIKTRIDLAQSEVFPTWTHVYQFGALLPAAAAIIFITLYPFLSLLAYNWWERGQIALKKAKIDINKKKPVDQEEHFKLVAQLDSLERKHEERIAILKGENKMQRDLANEYMRKLEDSKNEVDELLAKNASYTNRTKEVENEKSSLREQSQLVIKAKDAEINILKTKLTDLENKLENIRKQNRENQIKAASLQLARDLESSQLNSYDQKRTTQKVLQKDLDKELE